MTNPFYRAFVKDNLWVGVGQVLSFAKALILTPLVLKTAGVDVFGTQVLILSVAGFFSGFMPLGVSFNYQRYFPAADTPERKRKLFFPQFLFQVAMFLLAGVALMGLEGPIRKTFFRGGTDFSMWLIVFYMVLYNFYGQVSSYYRYSNRMRLYVWVTLAYPYLSVLLLFLFYWLFKTFTVDLLILTEILSLLITVLAFGVTLVKEMGLKIPAFGLADITSSMKHGIPLLMIWFTDFILFSSVRYIIAAYLAVADVGAYTAAVQLGGLLLFFPKSSGVALPPLLCRAADTGNIREARSMLNYAVKYYLLIAVPFLFLCLFAGKAMLSLFATPALAAFSWQLVPVIALGSLFYGLNLIVSNLNVVLLKTDLLFKASLTASALNLILNLILIGTMKSILPAAFTLMAAYLMVFVWLNYSLSREWTVDYGTVNLAKTFALSFVASTCGWAVAALAPQGGDILFVSVFLGVAGTVYLALLYPMGIVSRAEVDFLRKAVKPQLA